MLFYTDTVSGYAPAQPENLDAYHRARDALFSSNTAENKQEVTNQIGAWRKTCQEAFQQALTVYTKQAEAEKLPGYRTFCSHLKWNKIETLEGYQKEIKMFAGCQTDTAFGDKLHKLYQAHDANLSLLKTHEDKTYAYLKLRELLNVIDQSEQPDPEQPEQQFQYTWNALVRWFTTCFYGFVYEDDDTTQEAVSTLNTVLTNTNPPDGCAVFFPEHYAFTEATIRALGAGSLGRSLKAFIDNGSADILANACVHSVPEFIEALQKNYPSPIQTDLEKAETALSSLFTKYFEERIGLDLRKTPAQYYWGGLFKCFPNSKSLDEKIAAIEKLCLKIDNMPIQRDAGGWYRKRSFSRNHYFSYHSQAKVRECNPFDLGNDEPFTPEEIETLTHGNLGQALSTFINDKHASALLGCGVNSVTDFLTALDGTSVSRANSPI